MQSNELVLSDVHLQIPSSFIDRYHVSRFFFSHENHTSFKKKRSEHDDDGELSKEQNKQETEKQIHCENETKDPLKQCQDRSASKSDNSLTKSKDLEWKEEPNRYDSCLTERTDLEQEKEQNKSEGKRKKRTDVVYDEDGDIEVCRKRRKNDEQSAITIAHKMETTLKDVGQQIWLASLLMADFITYKKDEFKGKRVIDLGSGVGLTSVVAAMYVNNVICTDIGKDVLDLAENNLNNNNTKDRPNFQVMELDWFDNKYSIECDDDVISQESLHLLVEQSSTTKPSHSNRDTDQLCDVDFLRDESSTSKPSNSDLHTDQLCDVDFLRDESSTSKPSNSDLHTDQLCDIDFLRDQSSTSKPSNSDLHTDQLCDIDFLRDQSSTSKPSNSDLHTVQLCDIDFLRDQSSTSKPSNSDLHTVQLCDIDFLRDQSSTSKPSNSDLHTDQLCDIDFLRDKSSTLKPSHSDRDTIESCEIALSADVIYDDDVTDALFRTVYGLMTNTNIKTWYISTEKRYLFTCGDLDICCPAYQHFRECLTQLQDMEEGFYVSSIESFPQYFDYNRTKELELWKVTKTEQPTETFPS